MARQGGNIECKVYIGDLPEGASEKEVERAFEKFGRLRSVWVARNPPGFAFVEYEDVRDAEDAVKDMDGREVCHRRVRVEHASGRSKPKPWRGGGDRGRGPPRYDSYRDGGYGGGGSRGSYRDDGGRDGHRGGGRRTFNNDDKCYECGERGHYAYDCRNRGSGGGRGGRDGGGGRDRDRSRSNSRNRRSFSPRSRSRSNSRGRAARSLSQSPGRS